MPRKKKGCGDGIAIRGMFRLHVVDPDGTVAHDSGWQKNIVVDNGFTQYMVKALGSSADAGSLTHIALGSDTVAVSASQTAMVSEITKTNGSYVRTTFSTSTSAKSLAIYATWAASWNTDVTGSSCRIGQVGLFNSSATGTLFAAQSFTAATCNNNQAVNVTYNLAFATA